MTRTAQFLAIYDILFRGLSVEDSLSAMPLFGREEHNVHIWAFARSFEESHRQLYPRGCPDALGVLTGGKREL